MVEDDDEEVVDDAARNGNGNAGVARMGSDGGGALCGRLRVAMGPVGAAAEAGAGGEGAGVA